MAAASKVVLGYACTNGKKESKSVPNCNPEASNENVLAFANQINALQNDSVKTLTSVKRVETVELM